MADKKEEEYLDELLKSISQEPNADSNEEVVEPSEPEYQPDEDDDMAVLSQMFLNENGITNNDEQPDEKNNEDDNSDHIVEPVLSDEEFSAPDLSDTEETEETPLPLNTNASEPLLYNFEDSIISDEEDNYNEVNETNEPIEEPAVEPLADFSEESNENLDDIEDDNDFLSSLHDIIGETAATEDDNIETSDKSDDIFALDDSNDNIDETLQPIIEDTVSEPLKTETDEVKSIQETEKKKQKPEKSEKSKKEKKVKKKFSLKNFFLKFDDSEDAEPTDDSKTTVDENQQLMNELYKDEDSLDDIEVRDEETTKKEKKKKPKKEKPAKEKKPPKEKKNKAPKVKQKGGPKIKNSTLIIMVVITSIIICAVIFGGKIFTYNTAMKAARNNYQASNYTAAYDKICGMDIKAKDKNFYNGLKTIMEVQQGYESYRYRIKNNQKVEAIDALVKAVSRKYEYVEDAAKYNVESEVNTVYATVIKELSKYGIDEETALDLSDMNNYKEYMSTLAKYGGITSDSNN